MIVTRDIHLKTQGHTAIEDITSMVQEALAESGFAGMEDYTWIAMFLPAGTPPEIAQRLNEAVNRAIQAPDIRERLESLAFEPVGGTQAQFAEYVKAEIAKWGKVVRATGAKSD